MTAPGHAPSAHARMQTQAPPEQPILGLSAHQGSLSQTQMITEDKRRRRGEITPAMRRHPRRSDLKGTIPALDHTARAMLSAMLEPYSHSYDETGRFRGGSDTLSPEHLGARVRTLVRQQGGGKISEGDLARASETLKALGLAEDVRVRAEEGARDIETRLRILYGHAAEAATLALPDSQWRHMHIPQGALRARPEYAPQGKHIIRVRWNARIRSDQAACLTMRQHWREPYYSGLPGLWLHHPGLGAVIASSAQKRGSDSLASPSGQHENDIYVSGTLHLRSDEHSPRVINVSEKALNMQPDPAGGGRVRYSAASTVTRGEWRKIRSGGVIIASIPLWSGQQMCVPDTVEVMTHHDGKGGRQVTVVLGGLL